MALPSPRPAHGCLGLPSILVTQEYHCQPSSCTLNEPIDSTGVSSLIEKVQRSQDPNPPVTEKVHHLEGAKWPL